jgi:hypothetical protein
MPRFRAANLFTQRAGATRRARDRLDDGCVTALFGGNRQCIRLTQILAAIVELRRSDGRQDEAWTEAACQRAQHAGAQRRRERHVGHTGGGQLVAPETRMPRFGFGELLEDVASVRVALGRRERLIECGAVELVDQVGAKSLDVVDRLHGVVNRL